MDGEPEIKREHELLKAELMREIKTLSASVGF
jgi:hypothetical protein